VRFKNESFIYLASLMLQWTPLLLVISIFACENTHRVALGLANLRILFCIQIKYEYENQKDSGNFFN